MDWKNLLQKDDMDRVIDTALKEDLMERGDITTLAVVPESKRATARLVAKQDGVVAGLPVFAIAFTKVDSAISVKLLAADGDDVSRGDTLATMEGPARGILTAERVALNILGRLSGIATQTGRYVRRIEGTGARVLDTRKTTPGLRMLEKYAVAAGGGTNHRLGLYDAFLIKENHIAVGGGITASIKAARAYADAPVQIEVVDLDGLQEAIEAGADSVLLDNMTPAETAEAVALARRQAAKGFLLESSGGITLDTIHAYAETGVDRISIGALTHSSPALDLSLLINLE